MKYIFQFVRILGFCLAGEILHTLLPLPIPASIYGLVLLLAALKIGLIRLEQVKGTGHFLTGIFPLLFIPGAVGVVEQLDVLRANGLPVAIATLAVTALVFAAAGKTTDWMMGGRAHE